jgi:hypothetical protein
MSNNPRGGIKRVVKRQKFSRKSFAELNQSALFNLAYAQDAVSNGELPDAIEHAARAIKELAQAQKLLATVAPNVGAE